MHAIVDLNSGSGFIYGAPSAVRDVGVRINAHVDAALEAAHRAQPPRDYLGGSRISEPVRGAWRTRSRTPLSTRAWASVVDCCGSSMPATSSRT